MEINKREFQVVEELPNMDVHAKNANMSFSCLPKVFEVYVAVWQKHIFKFKPKLYPII